LTISWRPPFFQPALSFHQLRYRDFQRLRQFRQRAQRGVVYPDL
jgi:hypothetical protein